MRNRFATAAPFILLAAVAIIRGRIGVKQISNISFNGVAQLWKSVPPRVRFQPIADQPYGCQFNLQIASDGRRFATHSIEQLEEQKKRRKEMKNQFRNTIGIFAVAGAIVCLSGFATQASGVPDLAPALLAAGFKVRPATTAEQRSRLGTSPDNPFKMVNENGEPYYLYVDKKHEKLFVGNRFAYLAYINNIKNNQLREQGAFVWEVNPSNRALNRTIVVWPVAPQNSDWLKAP